MRWWDVRAPGYGSVLVKAEYRTAAVIEACNRMGCGEEDIKYCLPEEPLYERDRVPTRTFEGLPWDYRR